MNGHLTLMVCGLILAVSPLRAQKVVTEDSPTPEGAFILDAAKGGLAEIKMGKLAAENGTDPKVKEFVPKTVPVLQHHLEMAQELQRQEPKGS